MATRKQGRYNVLRGFNYPKSKALRDRIRKGEATSAESEASVVVDAGEGKSIPDDIAEGLLKRKVIEEA